MDTWQEVPDAQGLESFSINGSRLSCLRRLRDAGTGESLGDRTRGARRPWQTTEISSALSEAGHCMADGR